MTFRGILWATVAGLLVSVSVHATSSSSYSLSTQHVDSGGVVSSGGAHSMVFQSVSSIQSGTAHIGGSKTVHSGPYYSSDVADVSGYDDPFENLIATFTSVPIGFVTTKTEIRFKKEDGTYVTHSGLLDTNASDGWTINWDTEIEFSNVENTVSIEARAFDGLTWGPWREVDDALIFDNKKPNLSPTYHDLFISPNGPTSVGIDDTSQADVVVDEQYFDWVEMRVRSLPENVLKWTSDRRYSINESFVFDGKDSDGNYLPDGPYKFQFVLSDKVGNMRWYNQTLVIDNGAPEITSPLLTATGKALNSGLGDLAAGWTVEDTYDSAVKHDVSLRTYTPFSPLSISDMKLWFDAADADTLTTDSGDYVTLWEDKSGKNNHAVEVGSEFNPKLVSNVMNGLPALDFSTHEYATLAAPWETLFSSDTSDYTIVIVFKFTDTLNKQTVFRAAKGHTSGLAENTFLRGFNSANGNIYKLNDVRDFVSQSIDDEFGTDVNIVTLRKLSNTGSVFRNKDQRGSTKTLVNPLQLTDMTLYLGHQGGGTNGSFSGYIAEFIIYDKGLSDTEISQVGEYLGNKWGISGYSAPDTWTTDITGTTSTTWTKNGVDDATEYKVRITATDHAGNTTTVETNDAFTPDRTAPVIDGSFNQIVGTEDQDFVYSPMSHISDNYVSPINLVWTPELILESTGDPDYSDSVIENIRAINSYRDLEVTLIDDANTDSPLGGNLYGKENAYVKLKLEDPEGNYVEKRVQMVIDSVNDAPRFVTELGGPVTGVSTYYMKDPSTGRVEYSIKFDEDTVGPTLYLDNYVYDVDNDQADLTFGVFGPKVVDEGTGVFSHDYYDITIGDASSQHAMTVSQMEDFWGDIKLEFRASDTGGDVATRSFIARVWPVNDAPIVKDTFPTSITVDEDTDLSADFSAYEDDSFMEDLAPTYNGNLKWSVYSVSDGTFLQSYTGDNSLTDAFNFIPEANRYGTLNVVLKLRDADEYPSVKYPSGTPGGGYTSNPKETFVNLDLVWKPVNDAPTLLNSSSESIPNQIKDEDSTTWALDISDYRQDIEDADADLVWTIVPDRTDLLTYSFNSATGIFSFTPKANAWGDTKFTITLTDLDTGISFVPYTPNPLSATHVLTVSLTSVNDIPSITSITMLGAYDDRTDMVMTNDTITVTAIGFNDVGYTGGLRDTSELGDEYVAENSPQNQAQYNFEWYIDGDKQGTTKTLLKPTDSFSIDPTMEGSKITVKVYPDDGVDAGATLEKSISVNILPASVVNTSTTPANDDYFTDGDQTVSWNAVTDDDAVDTSGDNIWYRAKAWQVDKLAAPPSSTTLDDSGEYYDSGWMKLKEFNSVMMTKTFAHGSYYWKVWTGNQFSTDRWDYKETEWLNYFHIDLIAPEITDLDDLIQVDEIGQGAVIADAGITRVLYGLKPTDNINDGDSEGFLYQIRLVWENEIINEGGVPVITTGDTIIVDFTDAGEWTYTITYPEGTTTYNVVVQDVAGNTASFKQRHISGTKPDGEADGYTYSIRVDWENDNESVITNGSINVTENTMAEYWQYSVDYVQGTTTYNVYHVDTDGDTLLETFTVSNVSEPSELFTFTIIDDTTPPVPFSLGGSVLDYFEAVTSKNYYFLSGEKEVEAGLFYDGYNLETHTKEKAQIVGFTKRTEFVAIIYPTKPSGNITVQDRSDNIQPASTTVNIRFLIGDPLVEIESMSRSVINSDLNSVISAEPDIFYTDISWVSSRNIVEYAVSDADGHNIVSGTWVTANETTSNRILGSNEQLEHGVNVLTFRYADEAYNWGEKTFNLTVLKEAPNTDVLLPNTEWSKENDKWRLKVFGLKEDHVRVYVNNIEVTYLNNGSWQFDSTNFHPQVHDVIIRFDDVVSNQASITVWNSTYYSSYSSQTEIELPITELGLSSLNADGVILSVGTLPSHIAGIQAVRLIDGVYIQSGSLSATLHATAFENAVVDSELSISSIQQKKMYHVYAQYQDGAEDGELDISPLNVQVGLPFEMTDTLEVSSLTIVRLNEETGEWEHAGLDQVLDESRNRVVATLDKAGTYALAELKPFGSSLDDVRIYPNPWMPNDNNSDTGTQATGIVFDNLTTSTTIKIYTISGQLVKEESIQESSWSWDGRNAAGNPVFSGVYLYLLSNESETKTGKLTIIR